MKSHSAIASALVLAASTSVFAYQQGDIVVRGGLAYADPNTRADADTALNQKNLVDVDSAFSATFTGTYLFHKNFGVELVAALPFKHDIDGDGALRGVGKIGETKHLPPTLILQFYPLENNKVFSPYIGVGYNYTMFFGNDTTQKFTSTLNAVAGTHFSQTSLDLKNSSGVAAEIGADWVLANNLMLNASIWYIDIDTTAKIKGDGAEVTRFDVQVGPFVYSLGAAYKF